MARVKQTRGKKRVRKNIAKGWTLEKIRSYIRELKFLLWRMEFADEAETEAGEKLIGFIKGKQCFSGIFDTDNSNDSNGDVLT